MFWLLHDRMAAKILISDLIADFTGGMQLLLTNFFLHIVAHNNIAETK